MKKKAETVNYKASNDNVEIEQQNVEEVFDDRCCAQLKRFPGHTWAILMTELCERSSYYGVKTFLVLYLVSYLKMEKSTGKAVYHAFSMLSFFTGVIGAMVADSFTGKFKLIFWTLIVYSIAEVTITLTSLPFIGQKSSIGPLVGLFVMAAATGNIKPCVAAFGGEQINQKDTSLLSKFFALFYMSVNVGALISTLFIPILRTTIKCFGDDCYPAIFGINTGLILIATFSFMIGSRFYNKVQPEGNMITTVAKIVWCALTSKKSPDAPRKQHWLFRADHKYSVTEIEDVKALLKVLVMYIPLPVFWALFLQTGSSWTLQAEQMDGEMFDGGFHLRSDQIQFFNPLLVLIMIPLFDIIIYPMLERCRIPLSPLKKMTIGMFLAAVAFVVCGFMQIKIQSVEEIAKPNPGKANVDFINASPCETLFINKESFFSIELPYGKKSGYLPGQSGLQTLNILGQKCFNNENYKHDVSVTFSRGVYQTAVININNEGTFNITVLNQYFPEVNVETADSNVRVIMVPDSNTTGIGNLTFQHYLDSEKNVLLRNFSSYNTSYTSLLADEYYIEFIENSGTKLEIKLPSIGKFGTFGAYTVLLKRPKYQMYSKTLVAEIYQDRAPTTVHRIMQLPQYVILTAAEIMFSVTGLEFAYSQSPASMKSVIQAFWIVTSAFGDLIVVILSVAKPVNGVDKEMFLYAGVMVVVAFIFALMSCFYYTYSDFSGNKTEVNPLDALEEDELELKKSVSSTHL
ncbi:peptide transporter family 2 isoform X1 [Hydra vulgaris]|uniref:peptide transporter family 2 isoform X1 n=1 Tax=Hydra vulgaris TaxID=6087 RepID=UPI001F5FBC1F|nr:peptide transporter family 2 isoform X1 [Hydra vulgaris]